MFPVQSFFNVIAAAAVEGFVLCIWMAPVLESGDA